jgi:hypothetical protein
VEAIINDCNRASAIIARIRALVNKADTKMVALDINAAILESIELVHRELNNHGITLRQELAPGIPSINGDRVQLQQVIINLIMNGIEAMETVTDKERVIMVRSGRSDGDEAFVEIQDFGVGVDPANIDKLFDAFYTTKPKGLGMGLSISRSIIEAHDGRLTVAASGDAGTNSESLHRRPVRSKRQSTTPWNCRAPDRRSVVPNPSRVGGVGSGPPLSTQSSVSWPETSVHAISIHPSGLERAPYFTAFVVSSWTTGARKTASSDGQSISPPWSWNRERP